MIAGLYSAISGLSAQVARMDVAANNIANVSSVSYKSKSVQISAAGADGQGTGVNVVGTRMNMSQGPLMRTDLPTDLAITGSGYFRTENDNGNVSYTRAGDFTKDANGYLRSSNGDYLLGSSGRVQIPSDAVNFSVAKDGQVTSVDAQGNVTNAGVVTIATFGNEQGLVSTGNGYYTSSPASGAPQVSNPGSGNTGSLQSGALEMSNVDYISEMVNMMMAKREFTANTKAVQTADEMMDTLLNVFKK